MTTRPTTDGDTKAAMHTVTVFVLAESPPHFIQDDATPKADAVRAIWRQRHDEACGALDVLDRRLSEQEVELERYEAMRKIVVHELGGLFSQEFFPCRKAYEAARLADPTRYTTPTTQDQSSPSTGRSGIHEGGLEGG